MGYEVRIDRDGPETGSEQVFRARGVPVAVPIEQVTIVQEGSGR